MNRTLRTALVVVVAATVGACSWQEKLWEDGFIPLPAIALVRLAEPDETRPERVKLVSSQVLVGTLREAYEDDFRRDQIPWTWRQIPSLTETRLPFDLVGGAERFQQKLGLNFKVDAMLAVGDIGVQIGPSREIQLSKLWFLEAKALEPGTYHLVLDPLVAEFKPDPKEKTFFLLTKVLGGDISDTSDVAISGSLKLKSSQFPSTEGVTGGGSRQFQGYGVAMGVQGQILKRSFRWVDFPEQPLPIQKGRRAYALGKDRIVISRTDAGMLTFQWVGLPNVQTFSRSGNGKLQAAAEVPPTAEYVLLADLTVDGGRMLALQLGPYEIVSGAAYDVSFRQLDSGSLVTAFAKSAAPALQAPARSIVDSASWLAALGNESLAKEFVPVQQRILDIPVEPSPLTIAQQDVVEIFVPVEGDPAHYDQVRLTRYDVRGQGGRTFKHDVYQSESVKPVLMRLWAGSQAGGFEDITPQGPFTTSVQPILVPGDVSYLYARAGVRHKFDSLNLTGVHGARRARIGKLNWDIHFAGPIGSQCKLILGEAVAEGAVLPVREKGKLPGWAARLLALPSKDSEVTLRAIQPRADHPFDRCSFSVPDLGRRVGWVLYSARD